MEKRKLICKVLQWICLIIFGFTLFELLVKDNEDYFYGFLIFIPMTVLFIWEYRLEEEENPLSLARQKEAIQYAIATKHGNIDEFINAHGELMLEHFLKRGFIHRLYNSNRWEVTECGKLACNNHFYE